MFSSLYKYVTPNIRIYIPVIADQDRNVSYMLVKDCQSNFENLGSNTSSTAIAQTNSIFKGNTATRVRVTGTSARNFRTYCIWAMPLKKTTTLSNRKRSAQFENQAPDICKA